MGKARDLANVGSVASSGLQFRNKIINGAMTVDQRNNGASVTCPALSGDTYTLDRWQARNAIDAGYTVQRVADAPTGYVNSLRLTMTSADTSIGSVQYAQLRQHIEGLNVADFSWGTANAQPFTFSFWVKSSLTGTFSVSFANNSNTRVLASTYTINNANTWEYKTITVAGDNAGVWRTDSDIGIRVAFTLAFGSSFTGTANTWSSAETMGTSGSVQLASTNGATWQVTGVQLERGTQATPFEHRPAGVELGLCRRYFKWMPALQGNFITGGSAVFLAGVGETLENMRAAPTATLVSGTDGIHVSNVANYNITSLNDMNINYFRVNTNASAGSYVPGHYNSGNKISLNSEL